MEYYNKQKVLETIYIERKRKRISQQYMADQLGIKQGAYSLLERGASKMSVEYLYIICNELDISVIELLKQ